jgi:site-specific DNA-methyltransferase (adenine-specific)
MFCFSKGKPKKFRPIKRDCLHKGKRDYSSTFRNHGLDALEKRTEKVVKDKKVSDNVFTYTVGNESTTSYKPAFKHPAIFPERLAYDQIKSWTDEGDTVLDPMCGSGTTVFCANVLKRKAIGIDISSEYIELTRHRIKEEPIPKWLES